MGISYLILCTFQCVWWDVFFFFFFFFFGCASQLAGSQFPNQELNLSHGSESTKSSRDHQGSPLIILKNIFQGKRAILQSSRKMVGCHLGFCSQSQAVPSLLHSTVWLWQFLDWAGVLHPQRWPVLGGPAWRGRGLLWTPYHWWWQHSDTRMVPELYTIARAPIC